MDLGDALLGAVDVAHVQVDPHLLAHVHPSIYYTYTTICIIYGCSPNVHPSMTRAKYEPCVFSSWTCRPPDTTNPNVTLGLQPNT